MPTNIQSKWFGGPKADLGDPINQSLRFRNGSQQTLVGASTIPVDDTYTLSFWYKHTHNPSAYRGMLFYDTVGTGYLSFNAENGTYSGIEMFNGNVYVLYPPQSVGSFRQLRDPSAWFHCVITQVNGTSLTVYINGEQAYYTTSYQFDWTNFRLGSTNTTHYSCDGYIADLHHVDGTALTPTSFARYNEDGAWVPKTYTGTYGTNGFHLTFDSSQTNGIGHDSSGNNKNFTASNFNTTALSSSNYDNDIDYEDTPTNNFATQNPLIKSPTSLVHSEANLKNVDSNGSYPNVDPGTFLLKGKKYWECEYINVSGYPYVGVALTDIQNGGTWYSQNAAVYKGGGGFNNMTDNTTASFSASNGDVISLAYDSNTKQIQFRLNNGTVDTRTVNIGAADADFVPCVMNALSKEIRVNYGQRPFRYTPPTGYTALATNNESEPTIKNGKNHFEAVAYAGNNTAGHAITGFEFQPDLVWIKARNLADHHRIVDSVRGVSEHLISNADSPSNSGVVLDSFDSNGFTLHDGDGGWNGNYNYIAWCWKAGGAPTATNTAGAGNVPTAGSVKIDDADLTTALPGTIAAKKLTANTDAGFSIVNYTGTGANATVGHGLNSAPEFIIVKNKSTSINWVVYHTEADTTAPEDYIFILNSAAGRADNATMWNDTAPTNSVISLGSAGHTNSNGQDLIAYCWHSVEGFSKFGSYTGNGDSDGPFVYLGFKPALLVIKCRTQTEDWFVHDSGRYPNNPSEKIMRWNTFGSESGTGNDVDLLSNGFKIRNTGNDVNSSGHPFVYMAWAENPFGGENTAPGTAR